MERMRLKVCAVFVFLTSLAVMPVASLNAADPALLKIQETASTIVLSNEQLDGLSLRLERIEHQVVEARLQQAKKPQQTEGEEILSKPPRRRGIPGFIKKLGRWLKNIKNRIGRPIRRIVKPIREIVIDPAERIVERVSERAFYAPLILIKEMGVISEEDRRNLSKDFANIVVLAVNDKVVKSPLGEKIKQLDERFQKTDRVLNAMGELGDDLEIKGLLMGSKEELLDKAVKSVEGEIKDALVQEVREHEKYRKFEEFLEKVRQKSEELRQREGYQRVLRYLSKGVDAYEWAKYPEEKAQRWRERERKKIEELIRAKRDEFREKLQESLEYEILRLLNNPKYRKERARQELEREVALLSETLSEYLREKYNIEINIDLSWIFEGEIRTDKKPTSTDCLTPVPDEATHRVADFSEHWYMRDGAKVGPDREWYDKEKTKLKLLQCYNTKGRHHGYTIKYYYESGLKEYKRSYKHGKKDGVHQAWYEQPYKPKSIQTFKDDKLDGISATWAEGNRSLSYNIYENNQLRTRKIFNSKGEVTKVLKY